MIFVIDKRRSCAPSSDKELAIITFRCVSEIGELNVCAGGPEDSLHSVHALRVQRKTRYPDQHSEAEQIRGGH